MKRPKATTKDVLPPKRKYTRRNGMHNKAAFYRAIQGVLPFITQDILKQDLHTAKGVERARELSHCIKVLYSVKLKHYRSR